MIGQRYCHDCLQPRPDHVASARIGTTVRVVKAITNEVIRGLKKLNALYCCATVRKRHRSFLAFSQPSTPPSNRAILLRQSTLKLLASIDESHSSNRFLLIGSIATAQLGLGRTPFPITATAALPFALAFTVPSGRVTAARVNNKTFLSDDARTTEKAMDPKKIQFDPVQVAARNHANFAENVALAFVLPVLPEVQGANKKVLGTMLTALFGFRALHVVELNGEGALGNGRLIGHLGSLATVIGLAGYSAYLSKDFWGF